MVPNDSKKTAETLQKFSRDYFEATEVYAMLSQVEHVKQSFREICSAHVTV